MERTQFHKLIPWTGGLNTMADPGFTNDNDLVIADNIVFGTTGARQKREGFSYFDSAVPTPTHRSSSGTTRTLYFESTALVTASNARLVVGEKITVDSTLAGESSYEATNVAIASITNYSGTNYSITYTAVGSLTEAKTASTTLTVDRSSSYLNLTDYWRTSSNVKTALVMAVSSQGKLFKHDSDGNRLEVTATSGAPVGTVAHVNSIVFNDRLIVCFDAVGDKPIKYDPDVEPTYVKLGSADGAWSSDNSAQQGATEANVPDASFFVSWQGRLWGNDKTNKDRMHYSPIQDPETWGGYGDSGAIDIGVTGDGDSGGITAAWPYKGMLFVRKGRKTYRITGNFAPETYAVEEVTGSIGAVSQAAQAPLGDNDIIWVSKKGIHSGSATDTYGDVASQYVSAKIQPTFNDFDISRGSNFQATYIDNLNSVFFAITDGGDTTNGDLFAYNHEVKEWYRWPSVSCVSISSREVSDVKKLIMGTNTSRIIQAQNDTFRDYGSTGYNYKIKTPTIYPGKDLTSNKAFYRLRLYYKPVNRLTITVTFKVDDGQSQTQTLNHVAAGDSLGIDFTLGSSVLGGTGPLAPFSVPVTGIGRGCSVELQVGGSNEQITIYGMDIEYEVLDTAPEVNS